MAWLPQPVTTASLGCASSSRAFRPNSVVCIGKGGPPRWAPSPLVYFGDPVMPWTSQSNLPMSKAPQASPAAILRFPAWS